MADHLLRQLVLPDRFEQLEKRLGPEVANLLVAPDAPTLDKVRLLANEVTTRGEGVLVPVFGRTGVGKTTLAMNIGHWLPEYFAPSLSYDGQLDYEALVSGVTEFAKDLPADNRKVVPLNIDHREGAPPSDAELSTLKRFLRTNAASTPVLLLWPETSHEVATELARRYIAIAGQAAVELPLRYDGPAKAGWREIAKHTLSLANRVSHLEELGVNPEDYDPAKDHTLGIFLRRISHDFNRRVDAMRKEFEKPLTVVIAFASESSDPGVLSQLTSPSRYGLLDGHALVSVTAQSEIGKWWAARLGLLTRTIVQLNASAFTLSPTAAASCVRNCGEGMEMFDTVGYKRYGPHIAVRDLGRSDLGKMLTRVEMSRFEARGTPAKDATAAFQLMAEEGFNLGKDKNLNKIMHVAVEALLKDAKIPYEKVTSETALPFCALIPDNAIYYSDTIQCVEYTWRKGEFLSSGNRSTVATYILTKLQKYARQLGWTSA